MLPSKYLNGNNFTSNPQLISQDSYNPKYHQNYWFYFQIYSLFSRQTKKVVEIY